MKTFTLYMAFGRVIPALHPSMRSNDVTSQLKRQGFYPAGCCYIEVISDFDIMV